MEISKKIFKAYDIRGIYPEELNEETAYRIGKAFIKHLEDDALAHQILGEKKEIQTVIVGYDMRPSSPVLAEKVIQGILEQGKDVINIGQVNTDLFYFSCQKKDCPGIMVTASHNPKEYNGFKMMVKVPFTVGGGAGMEEIYEYVVKNYFVTGEKVGQEVQEDYTDEYIDKLLSLVDINNIRSLKIVADTGNGMAGPFAKKVFAKLPVELIEMNFKVDGENSAHGWDPMQPENRKDLEVMVVSSGADIGFAFDGDADRLFIIDNNGKMIPGDFVTALMSENFLDRNREEKSIIYDIRSSWAVRDMVKTSGGVSIPNKVGHTYIKKRMIKENAIFGGEITGHYYFKDFYYCDSALAAALVFLEYICKAGKSISEIIAPLYEKYFISGEINSTVEEPEIIMKELEQRYQDGKVSNVDGLSVEFDNWHFNVRKSNTEPLLRLNLEAISKELMKEKRDEILEVIRK